MPVIKPLLDLLDLQKLPMYKLLSGLHIPDCPGSLTLDPIKHIHWHFDWLPIQNISRWESNTILLTIAESQLRHRYGCQIICITLMDQTSHYLFYSFVLPFSLPISLRVVVRKKDYLGTKQAPQTLDGTPNSLTTELKNREATYLALSFPFPRKLGIILQNFGELFDANKQSTFAINNGRVSHKVHKPLLELPIRYR